MYAYRGKSTDCALWIRRAKRPGTQSYRSNWFSEETAMGMDVCGLKPKTKTGEFFGASIAYWTPIWDYVAETCADLLTEDQITGGYANDGVRVRAKQAEAVGTRLRKLVRSGETAEHIAKTQKRGKNKSGTKSVALKNVRKLAKALGGKIEDEGLSVEAVRKFANFCVASGGFEID